jgi:hypothetical protein
MRSDDLSVKRTDVISNPAGGIKIKQDEQVDVNSGSSVPDNKSQVLIQDAWGSLIRFISGNIVVRTVSDLCHNIGGHHDVSVKGNKQEVVAGKHTTYSHQDHSHLQGTQGDDEQKHAQELQKSHDRIQNARIDAIKNTKGEKVECPNCGVKHLIDDKSSLISKAFAYIRRNCPPSFCFPFDSLERLLNTLVAPFLSQKTNIGISGTKGCGSPGCVNGQVDSPLAAMKAADQATAQAYAVEASTINNAMSAMGLGSAHLQSHKGDVVVNVGLKSNDVECYVENGHHTTVTGLRAGPARTSDLSLHSKGNPKRIIHLPPARTPGSWMFNVANNFTIKAGAPGIDLKTVGHTQIDAGSITAIANRGEAAFGSGNVTTLKGKMVIIDANDMSGDSGFSVQSRFSHFTGAVSVQGNLAVKGEITCDGPISTPYIIAPTMRQVTTVGSSSKLVNEGANWLASAQALAATNFAKDSVLKYTFTGCITQLFGMYSFALEFYNLAQLEEIIEPIPTGELISVGLGNLGYPVFSWGFVWNYKHNHLTVGGDHTHDFDMIKGSYYEDRAGWGQERGSCGDNPIPTTAPVNGDGTGSGPKAKPGGCGGGGLFTKARNQFYNLDVADVFNGGNYVPLPIQRTPAGTLIPEPQFSPIYSMPPLTAVLTPPLVPTNVLPLSAECP